MEFWFGEVQCQRSEMSGNNTRAFKKLSTLYHEILISLAPRTAISVGPAYLEKIFLADRIILNCYENRKASMGFLRHDGIL